MPVTDLQTCEDKDLFWVSLSAEKAAGFGEESQCKQLETRIGAVLVPDAADEYTSPSQVAEPIESKLNHDRR